MARKQRESRPDTLKLDNEYFEKVTVTVETNLPFGAISKVVVNEPATIVDFLEKCLMDWTGMDGDDGPLKCDRDGIESLSIDEVRSLGDVVIDGIQNPPSKTKGASPVS